MNKLAGKFLMLGLCLIAYTPKVHAARSSFPEKIFTSQIKSEIISVLAQANASTDWKEFYSNEGKFSVFVPDTSVVNLNSDNEEYSLNIYYANTRNISYLVGYVDYKTDIRRLPLRKIYNKFLKKFLGHEIDFLNRQKIILGKYPGIEAEYRLDNQEEIAKIRLFLVEKRLYILDISNFKAGDAKQFFNSFQLEDYMQENPSEIATIVYFE